jgi:hypothetical protein
MAASLSKTTLLNFVALPTLMVGPKRGKAEVTLKQSAIGTSESKLLVFGVFLSVPALVFRFAEAAPTAGVAETSTPTRQGGCALHKMSEPDTC